MKENGLFNNLRDVMAQPAFWRSQQWQVVMLFVIVGFWVFQGVGVASGTPAPPAWIVSACVSIIISAILTAEIFMGSAIEKQRYLQGMLLIQLFTNIVGNLVVIVMEVIYSVPFTGADWLTLGTDAAGILVVIDYIKAGRFGWKSPWAKCGYAISLKVNPQFWTAFCVFIGWNMLHPGVVVCLVTMGLGRLIPAWQSRRIAQRAKNVGSKDHAQFALAGTDLFSILCIAAGVVTRLLQG